MEVISSGEGRELTLTLRGELDHHAAKEAMRSLNGSWMRRCRAN